MFNNIGKPQFQMGRFAYFSIFKVLALFSPIYCLHPVLANLLTRTLDEKDYSAKKQQQLFKIMV